MAHQALKSKLEGEACGVCSPGKGTKVGTELASQVSYYMLSIVLRISQILSQDVIDLLSTPGFHVRFSRFSRGRQSQSPRTKLLIRIGDVCQAESWILPLLFCLFALRSLHQIQLLLDFAASCNHHLRHV